MSKSILRNKISAFLPLLIFAALIFACPAGVRGEAYDISDYRVEMRLSADRSCQVRELVDLYFHEESQGIIRRLPLYNSVETFTVGDIRVEGDPFVLEEGGDYIDVRIGEAGTYIEGEKRYDIAFTRFYYQDYDPEFDWYYADLIPGDWDCSIDSAEIAIALPGELLDYTLHFGSVGSTGGESGLTVAVENGRMTVKNNRRIENGEAITLMAKFPQGTFAEAPEKVYPYRVASYEVDATLNGEGNLQVKESAVLSFGENIGTVYYGLPVGSARLTDFHLESGEGKRNDSTLNLAGAAAGEERTYVFTYTLVFAADRNDGFDLFYHAFPGSWQVPVEKATLSIALPAAATRQKAVFSYRDDKDYARISGRGNAFVITGAEPLVEGETIQFQLEFPDGTFVKRITPPELAGILLAVIVSFLALLLYYRYGKDGPIVPVVEFYPPDGMNPAEVGYIIDRNADALDATSLIFYWASRGHLTVENRGKGFILRRQKELEGEGYRPYEKRAFAKLWALGDGDSVDDKQLKGNYYVEVQQIKRDTAASFSGPLALIDKKSKIISWLVFGLGVAILPIIPFAAAFTLGGWIGGGIAYLGALAPFLFVALFFHRLADRLQRRRHRSGGVKRALWILFFVLVSAFVLLALGLLFTLWDLKPYAVWICLGGGFFTVFLSAFITKRSAYGHNISERVVGFRDFLRDAEKEKLEAMLEQNPQYFYDILPYAQVLGVTKIWGDKFAGMALAPPSWYRYDGRDFTTAIFVANYMQMNNRMRHSAASPPKHEGGGSGGGGFGGGGFGGGGFSGGGGGGGGRSW